MPPRGLSRRPPFRAYIGALVALLLVAVTVSLLYSRGQDARQEEDAAQEDAEFSARLAASAISSDLAALRSSVAGVAANPGIGALFTPGAVCTLTFGSGVFPTAHLDLVASDGSVVCSSDKKRSGTASYRGASWLADAARGPVFVDTAADPVNDHVSAISAAPVPGKGVIAGFVDLSDLGATLAARFGRPHMDEFVVVTRDRPTIVARSLDAARWAGASIADTDLARVADPVRRGVDGTLRVYGESPVADSGWSVLVGVDHAAVIATADAQFASDTVVAVAALAIVLFAVLFTYRRVTQPVAELNAAIRRGVTSTAYQPVRVSGPREVAQLAEDFNAMIATVRAELRQRRQAEDRFTSYFRASPVPATIARASDSRIVDVNEAFVETFGFARDDLIGRSAVDVGLGQAPGDRQPAVRGALPHAQRIEVTLRTKSGEARDTLSLVQPTEIDGEAYLIIGAVDLTERKRVEALERERQVLQQATRAKSEFLANMSHELRTPLNAILGFSDLLLERLQLNERERRFLNNIRDAGGHLLALINDVLDLAKVEAGKVDLRPELVSLAGLLEPVIASTRAAATAKGLSFDTEVPGAASLYLDATRARQILYNLLSNAVKFTPPGGRVRLGATCEGPDLLIAVTDTGIGIPRDKWGRVFGSFERLHEGRSSAPGTGLGLALTKQLVEVQGGTITFDSVEGAGTTFRVRLPGVRSEPVYGDRILIVEDERHDADLVVALASMLDLRSEVARGLGEARAAVARSRPLGVVIDLRFPDGRGEDLLPALKNIEDPIPAIVITVEAEPATALALGVDDYLTKPIDRARLERWLRAVARIRSAPSPA